MNKRIRSELRRLADADSLTPANVVDRAKTPSNPMHSYFEWDDGLAAQKFRLEQARTLIASFEVVFTVNRIETRVQEFVRDPFKKTDEQGYTTIDKVKTDHEMAREFLLRELAIAKTYVDKTFSYAKVLGLYKDVQGLSRSLDALRQKLTSH